MAIRTVPPSPEGRAQRRRDRRASAIVRALGALVEPARRLSEQIEETRTKRDTHREANAEAYQNGAGKVVLTVVLLALALAVPLFDFFFLHPFATEVVRGAGLSGWALTVATVAWPVLLMMIELGVGYLVVTAWVRRGDEVEEGGGWLPFLKSLAAFIVLVPAAPFAIFITAWAVGATRVDQLLMWPQILLSIGVHLAVFAAARPLLEHCEWLVTRITGARRAKAFGRLEDERAALITRVRTLVFDLNDLAQEAAQAGRPLTLPPFGRPLQLLIREAFGLDPFPQQPLSPDDGIAPAAPPPPPLDQPPSDQPPQAPAATPRPRRPDPPDAGATAAAGDDPPLDLAWELLGRQRRHASSEV
jgi:hypothetical protein